MLYTASFYEPAHWVGVRYRVSRGHPRGRQADWSTQPFLYPSRELLREYQGGGIDFPVLDVRYREELERAYDAKAEFRTWLQGLPLGRRRYAAVFRAGGEALSPEAGGGVAAGMGAGPGAGADAVAFTTRSVRAVSLVRPLPHRVEVLRARPGR